MVYRLINSTYNVKELTLRLTRLLCQFIKASSASVFVLDDDKKQVTLVAHFDNKINIFFDKKRDLRQLAEKELRVTRGYIIFEKNLIGLPLVADDNIGAIFVRREAVEPAFTEFDRELLSVVAEQAVTAIRNLQLNEGRQKVILGSIEFIGKLLKERGAVARKNTSAYFQMVKSLALKLKMNQEDLNSLYYATVLRDAGVIDIPYEILSKTSRLTPEEFKIIRDQPQKSAELIRPVEFLRPVLPIILCHHEKYDGTGYPSGLKKDQIPLGARVMAIVDAFDAMTTERPYKKTLGKEAALGEIRRNSGTQFDPLVVAAFVELSLQKNFRNCLRTQKP
ncbi:MAG: HD domain-containing protein [Candidatus Omnitrophica bacterium]|nr:HD domain-containing protein [Candidatus Omnitrophota bacterium]